MNNLSIYVGDVDIRTDEAGRYCLGDLHKASGGEPKHQPNNWLANQQTKDLVMELESTPGIPGVVTINGGNSRGTYVPKQMVYAYATWINAKFFLQVINAYDKLVTGSIMPNFSNPAEAAIEWARQYTIAQEAIRTKAEIGSRREATAMNTASQATKKVHALEVELDRAKDYSSVKRMETICGIKFDWRILKSASSDLGVQVAKVFDANYGSVNAYHRDAWLEGYALDIDGNRA